MQEAVPVKTEQGFDILMPQCAVADVDEDKLVLHGHSIATPKPFGHHSEHPLGVVLNMVVETPYGHTVFPRPSRPRFHVRDVLLSTTPFETPKEAEDELQYKLSELENDLLKGGAQRVWRIWRSLPTALPLVADGHRYYMADCYVVMLGVCDAVVSQVDGATMGVDKATETDYTVATFVNRSGSVEGFVRILSSFRRDKQE